MEIINTKRFQLCYSTAVSNDEVTVTSFSQELVLNCLMQSKVKCNIILLAVKVKLTLAVTERKELV
ncbi:putative type II secretion system protein [Trichinella spiralis]|uniref:putative type II secretion system protein n=1 Tax=Trichinella spiralis TaxID=6334 RepID=UPI0001EFB4EA|nr:putative type II secretion system protein [Trichinella spiralis]